VSPHLFMDPLHKLWELYDQMNVVPKPELKVDEPSAMGTPQTGQYDHPVIQQRKQVDDAIAQGMSPEEAHSQVYGEVKTDDVDSKASFASTLGRIQHNNDKKGVRIDKGPFKSLLAQETEREENMDGVTPDDLRTPERQEVPDELQLDKMEEYDYNQDVAYLQQYGRA
jgi:hypothetical protein